MKLGIDSYSYHRYFGEIYAGIQKEPECGFMQLQVQFLVLPVF